mmetsp:Transcript_41849/g.130258  ORF Transcript_41849/g.130258 Transcript_41849/m.130258 type:complete len:396 (-) Transcript_41849:64-1251(-)
MMLPSCPRPRGGATPNGSDLSAMRDFTLNLIGSFQGLLHMYCPKQMEYKIEDLIYEKNMEAPILQIAAGKFVQGSRELCLALLHPMKLAVYMVSAVSSGGSVNYYSLAQAYEHQLVRPAFNLCHGPFGQIRDRDYVCVQSLDGVLSFFEQDAFAFSRLLSPGFLVPGPLCYAPKIDSFIVCSSAMCIEAYRYQVLAAAAENVDQDPGSEGASGKKVQVDWSTNIGEHARSISVARFSRSLSASQQEILVVGEHTVFTVKESGGIRLQKRLCEYGVTSAVAYRLPPEAPDSPPVHNLLLSTQAGHLMIFKEMQLVWCARLRAVEPVQAFVETICGVRGMIVCMRRLLDVRPTWVWRTFPASRSGDVARPGHFRKPASGRPERRILRGTFKFAWGMG